MKIALHIKELVLHGLAGVEGREVAAAVEAALRELIAERGLPAGLADKSTAGVDGGAFELVPGGGAEAIGAQVAAAIYGGLR